MNDHEDYEEFEDDELTEEDQAAFLQTMSFISEMQQFTSELAAKNVWLFLSSECLHIAHNGVNIKLFTEIGAEDPEVAVTDSDYNVLLEVKENQFDILRDFIISELGLTRELQP